MSLVGKTNEEKIYNFLIAKIKNPFGVAGLMGNLQAESGCNPKNLQQTYEKKLGFKDATYTEAVDTGTYSNFVRDSAGFGLAQWTWWSRKKNLLSFAQSKKKSIGDLEMQLEFLWNELSTSYKHVLKVLTSAKTVLEASNVVLFKYESPHDQGEAEQKKRCSYGQTFYNQFAVPKYERQAVVDLSESWVGKKESDGSHKEIIDIYNTQKKFPRGTKMRYDWAWCACTWSALGIKLKYTPIMPVEISCYYLIELAKQMGIWQEADNYVPKPADGILYDWDDNGSGDNKGNPDHVGVITYVNEKEGYMIAVEGNYSNAVKKRTISLNGKFIRGFITPKYTVDTVSTPVQVAKKDTLTVAREVIAGIWGSGTARKTALEKAGYDYKTIQSKVNEILNTPKQTTAKKVETTCTARFKDVALKGTYKTTTNLYLRNDAGSNKKALAVIPKNTKVQMYGYYNVFNNVKWYLVQYTLDGVEYTGFCSSNYLTKA